MRHLKCQKKLKVSSLWISLWHFIKSAISLATNTKTTASQATLSTHTELPCWRETGSFCGRVKVRLCSGSQRFRTVTQPSVYDNDLMKRLPQTASRTQVMSRFGQTCHMEGMTENVPSPPHPPSPKCMTPYMTHHWKTKEGASCTATSCRASQRRR